jgi:hypothetical protein
MFIMLLVEDFPQPTLFQNPALPLRLKALGLVYPFLPSFSPNSRPLYYWIDFLEKPIPCPAKVPK